MKRHFAWILIVFFTSTPIVPAAAATETPQAAPLIMQSTGTNGMVRVWLSSVRSETVLNLTIDGSYVVGGHALSGGSHVKVEFSGGAVYITAGGMRNDMGGDVTLARLDGGVRIAETLAPGNAYPGDFRFFIKDGVSYVICALFIEDYVRGVLPYEMDDSFPLEALKAQAVAARTYAARAITASGEYDVTDTISHQLFRGVDAGKTRCIAAADETRGIVIAYKGLYIEANYGASNGGQTELNSNAWGSVRADYLQIKDDPYDLANSQSVARTYMIFRTSQLGSSPSAYAMIQQALADSLSGLAGSYSIEEVVDVSLHTPKFAPPSRLYTRMRVDVRYNGGQTATVDIPVFPTVKDSLGLSINATDNELLTVSAERDGFHLQARRFGHGVGMSQRGAQQMAQQGMDFRQILGFYYNGIELIVKNFTVDWAGGANTAPPAEKTSPPAAESIEGRVALSDTNSRLNLRQAPGLDGQVIAYLSHGASVAILAEQGDWYQVRYGKLTGYASKAYIALDARGPESGGMLPSPEYAMVALANTRDMLNLRQSPSLSAAVLKGLAHGTQLIVLEKGFLWTKVSAQGLVGYVMNIYIVDQSQGTTASADDPSATQTWQGIVSLNCGTLNLRSQPNMSAGIIIGIPNHAAVTVTQLGDSWCAVRYGGKEGYVMRQYLAIELDGNSAPAEIRYLFVKTAGDPVNLRREADGGSGIIATVPNGARVILLEKGDAWTYVSTGTATGYIASQYLSES